LNKRTAVVVTRLI